MNHPQMPFLSILTPTYKRPTMLEVCRESVRQQTRFDVVQQLIMEDTQGIGVGGQYSLYGQIAPLLPGDYVMVLCDDDYLCDPHLVEDMISIVDAHHPQLIMVRWQYDKRVLPDGDCWHGEPREGFLGLSNWIVSGNVWRAFAHCHGNRYAGDFDFIAAIWPAVRDSVYWHDKIVVATQKGRGFGKEEQCTQPA